MKYRLLFLLLVILTTFYSKSQNGSNSNTWETITLEDNVLTQRHNFYILIDVDATEP